MKLTKYVNGTVITNNNSTISILGTDGDLYNVDPNTRKDIRKSDFPEGTCVWVTFTMNKDGSQVDKILKVLKYKDFTETELIAIL